MRTPDLFADSTMTFGEHLEVLRRHLARSVIYLLIACIPATFAAEWVLDAITAPAEEALAGFDPADGGEPGDDELGTDGSFWDDVKAWLPGYDKAEDLADRTRAPAEPELPLRETQVRVTTDRNSLRRELDLPPIAGERGGDPISFTLDSEAFRDLSARKVGTRLVTKSFLEAFSVYLKTIIVTAFLIASPGILTELWLFVGAGLFPHERKYVYYFLPVSLGLFAAGAAFCFLVVFQFVLPFLLSFNALVETTPLIEAGGWFSFVLLLPGVFGLSFQLPLVMLFFNRIGAVDVKTYWERMNLAVLIIAGVSMLLTPTDPGSMIAMMIPLIGLYFVGMAMCKYFPTPTAADPFAEEAPTRERIEA